MQKGYFAASNSAEGFKNYYPEVFKRADFIYVIKGGPGTGKSSFMKRCSAVAERRGGVCEYYYCSSDPESLDGVLIFTGEKTVGILDGTAPHVCEPKFPGAREEIINFAPFWNTALLYRQQNEIISLSERKSAEYKNAYTFLRSVGNLRAVSDSLIEPALDREKMSASISRILRDIDDVDEPSDCSFIPALTDSVSMKGRVRFDTLERTAQTVYRVADAYGTGQFYLDEMLKQLKSKKGTVRISYDPVCPSHVDGLLLEECGTAFVLGSFSDDAAHGESCTFINMRRFLDGKALREVRSEIRYTAHLAESSLDGALHALSKARIYHFLLEDIYGGAMDWQRFGEIDVEGLLDL